MTENEGYSPAPWEWTDYGILSDANGEPVIDHQDWNVSTENAVMLQRAPELYECLRRIREECGDLFLKEMLSDIDRVLNLATRIIR